MSEEKKPREFWIDPDETNTIEETDGQYYPCGSCFNYNPKRSDWNIIHVIEKSAYASLKARHEKLLEALKEISKEFGTDYADGNTIIAREAIDADGKAGEE